MKGLGTLEIRPIQEVYICFIKELADQNRESLGFTTKQKFQEVMIQKRGLVAIENEQVVGFVIYRHRKLDTQTTLSEICVTQERRGHHIGKKLIDALVEDCIKKSRAFIQLKCPIDLPANEFYRKLGFKLIAIEDGKKQQLNVWQLLISAANQG